MQDYDNSIKYLEDPAQEGNVYAQNLLGILNDIHLREFEKSREWFEKAIENGSIEAIYNLGKLNMKFDKFSESQKCFEQGIEAGSKECEYMLGVLHFQKSMEIFNKMSKDDYLNTRNIVDNLVDFEICVDDIMLSEFKELKFEDEFDNEEVHNPSYILDIYEDLEEMMEERETAMIVVEGEE